MRVLKPFLILLSVIITITFLYFENHFSGIFLGVAVLFYLFSSVIHLLAHESGHFIGGIISGYKLLYLQLGPINIIVKRNNKPTILWKVSLNKQCVMIPKQIKLVRFKAYNLGGIFANILVMFSSLILLLCDSLYYSLLLIELLCVGMQKVLLNAIPHKMNSIPNDGYIVKLLKNNNAVQKDYAMYLRLYGSLFLNEEDVSLQDYIYEREISINIDEMLYYNEIQNILNSLKVEKD